MEEEDDKEEDGEKDEEQEKGKVYGVELQFFYVVG